ncbi:hypothetical protein CYMTET_3333 [Cymbomonas tetramitiformis]|uniref:Uncharacterized protein n=1 Tax=Cymbomonas tetramitiformis TaxID=36881 RepID=A0AAE0H3J3_9CHLO|nr:hypothetical protein CYMTET_36606 [Cymbomonas tetramitiformis]KAK3289242.1 hypothetical protein CYMTET_3333 [Cymbomonas tetramitiformis]
MSQPIASSVDSRAGGQLTQQRPVPSGVLEAIVDGTVTYNSAGAPAASAAIPSSSPPASRILSPSALLPPEPAARGMPVRYSHMGTLTSDAGGRTQTALGRHARRTSGPDTLRKYLPPRSDSPLAHNSSGSESDRGSTLSFAPPKDADKGGQEGQSSEQ